MSETVIYVTRHAEAEGNVYRRCHGVYDSMLTPRGLEQLPYLARRFAEVPVCAVYASHLYRARVTARAVADVHGLPVLVRPVLHEIDMGVWEDIPWAELPRLYPEHYRVWLEAPWESLPPGGEGILPSGERLLGGLREIARENAGKQVVAVTHGSAIKGALTIARGLAPEQLGETGWGDNTCVAKFVYHEDGRLEVEYWNDASHLPQELSTFRSIGWKDTKDQPTSPQLWFRPVDLDDPEDTAALMRFARQKYESAYGSAELLDEGLFLDETRAMRAAHARAVTFGMLEDTPAALVRLDARVQGEDGRIGSLVIDRPWRGHGLSQQIIGQAISVYRALGKANLCALVAEHNGRAQGFYHKFGFQKDGEVQTGQGRHYRMRKPIQIEPYTPET